MSEDGPSLEDSIDDGLAWELRRLHPRIARWIDVLIITHASPEQVLQATIDAAMREKRTTRQECWATVAMIEAYYAVADRRRQSYRLN